jgi:hypothetical protein
MKKSKKIKKYKKKSLIFFKNLIFFEKTENELTRRPLDLARRPIMPTAPNPTASGKSRRVRLTRRHF